ncbi:MAG: response regulator [Candidatus Aquirickettsiella sp.]
MKEEKNEKNILIVVYALLIEDDKICQGVMYCHLSNLGYEVDLAENAKIAIQKIQRKKYDLIALDLRLPDQYGTEIIKAVRRTQLNIDTVLLVWSAHLNKKDHEAYLSMGADNVLPKPCCPKYLEKIIRQSFLYPKYKRKFHFQLKIIKRKLYKFLEIMEHKKDLDIMNEFRSLLKEGILISEEYKQWLNFSINNKEED